MFAAVDGIGHRDRSWIDPDEAYRVFRVRHIKATQAGGRGQSQGVRARLRIPSEETYDPAGTFPRA